jgi:hypothetical protein
MKELSQIDCQFINGGFPEVTPEYPGKVLNKDDICHLATFGILFGGITGLVKLSSYPLIGVSMGAVLGGILLPITAHYVGNMMLATYEMSGII